MSDLRAIRDDLIREFRASGSYNRTAIWQGIGRVMDRAIEAEAAVEPAPLDVERLADHTDSPGCWCHPYQDTIEPTVWIHRQEARG